MRKFASIYVLFDPRDGRLRYVGWTTATLVVRLCQHLSEARFRPDAPTYRIRWLRKLLRLGLRPTIKRVEHVSVKRGPVREQYWIKFYRKRGCDLVNSTDGGEGTPGRRQSDKTVTLWANVRSTYRRTKSIRATATETGISKRGVEYVLRKLNISRYPQNRCGVESSSQKAIRPHSPSDLVRNESLMYALYVEERRSIPEIAEIVGVSRTTVITGLRQCKISTRSKSEALLCKFRKAV